MIKDRLQGTFWEFWSEFRHDRFSSIKVQRKHWIIRMAAYRKHMPTTHNTQCRVGKSCHFRQSHVFNLPSNPVTCVHSGSQGFRSTRLPSEPQLHQTWTRIFSFVHFWGNLLQFSKHPQQSILWVIASIEVHVAKVLGHHTWRDQTTLWCVNIKSQQFFLACMADISVMLILYPTVVQSGSNISAGSLLTDM